MTTRRGRTGRAMGKAWAWKWPDGSIMLSFMYPTRKAAKEQHGPDGTAIPVEIRELHRPPHRKGKRK